MRTPETILTLGELANSVDTNIPIKIIREYEDIDQLLDYEDADDKIDYISIQFDNTLVIFMREKEDQNED